MCRIFFLNVFYIRKGKRYDYMIDRSCALTHNTRARGIKRSDHLIQLRININYILYKEHVRINLFSNTNDNKNSASTLSLLSSGILFFCVCLHWFSKQHHHSHPFVQQQRTVFFVECAYAKIHDNVYIYKNGL